MTAKATPPLSDDVPSSDTPHATERATWRDYFELTKPRVVTLITFTAMVGMFLARPQMVPWSILLFGSLGIALCAGSAAAINHLVDRHLDAMMSRTQHRPLPQGHLTTVQVLGFATAIGLLGAALLLIFTNPLTTALTVASLFGYAVIYTLFLKHATPQNIVIGGASGATPPILGWTAVTDAIEPGALLLFLIIFVWTPPHFWALAIHRRHDYAKAAIPMLPVTHGVTFTTLHSLLYTWLLVAVTLLPFAIGMSGGLYLLVALVLGGMFIWHATRLHYTQDERFAMPMFGFSIVYLFILFATLMVDHSLRGWVE